MTDILQGTVRASKKQNAKMKLERQYKDRDVKVILEKTGNNKWDYMIILDPIDPEKFENLDKGEDKEESEE